MESKSFLAKEQNNAGQEQRTLDWHRARLGMFTGSNIHKLMQRKKDGTFYDTAKTYIYLIAAQRALNPKLVENDDTFAEYVYETNTETKAMRFGTYWEDDARKLFSHLEKVEVLETGSVPCKGLQHFASSPDGIIKDNKGNLTACVEIKCPQQETFMRYRDTINSTEDLKREKPEYYYQCQAHMMCTGAKECYFVVFSPFMLKPLHVVKVSFVESDSQAIKQAVMEADEYIKEHFNL